jgi:hypothetical protein
MRSSELFEKILEHPELYVGKPSIALINAFIAGYEFEKNSLGFKDVDKLYFGFNIWVAKRFKIETMHGWSAIITFMGQSEVGSFEMTKTLWQEYKSNREKKKKK